MTVHIPGSVNHARKELSTLAGRGPKQTKRQNQPNAPELLTLPENLLTGGEEVAPQLLLSGAAVVVVAAADPLSRRNPPAVITHWIGKTHLGSLP